MAKQINPSCLLMFAPCILDALQGPTASSVCSLLNQTAAPIYALGGKEAAQKMVARAKGVTNAFPETKSNVVTPACNVDIVSQIKAQTEATEAAKKAADSVEKVIETLNSSTQALLNVVEDCPAIQQLILILKGSNDLIDNCRTISNSTAQLVINLQAGLDSLIVYFENLINISILSAKWLQILANFGICTNNQGTLTVPS